MAAMPFPPRHCLPLRCLSRRCPPLRCPPLRRLPLRCPLLCDWRGNIGEVRGMLLARTD